MYVQYGGDVNSTAGERHDFRTVLHYAVMSGQQETVRYLVRQGARVNFPCDYEKPTPLDLAIIKGDVDMVRLLIELGQWLDAELFVSYTRLFYCFTPYTYAGHDLPKCSRFARLVRG